MNRAIIRKTIDLFIWVKKLYVWEFYNYMGFLIMKLFKDQCKRDLEVIFLGNRQCNYLCMNHKICNWDLLERIDNSQLHNLLSIVYNSYLHNKCNKRLFLARDKYILHPAENSLMKCSSSKIQLYCCINCKVDLQIYNFRFLNKSDPCNASK